jgi:prepilin-type N-terminal cleavage/methylation domain-containing protein
MWRASGDGGAQPAAKGVTLLEVLVASALFAMVLAGVYSLYTAMHGSLTRGETKSDLQQNARVGLDRVVQELRMAGYDPESALAQIAFQPFNELRAAGSHCLSFVTSRTVGGSERTVRVTYHLSGTTLRRRVDSWNPASQAFSTPPHSDIDPVAEAVHQLAFAYYDAFDRLLVPSGAALGGCPPGGTPSVPLLDAHQAAQVRRVGIVLRTLETRPRTAPESYTLTSHVHLRNR